MVHSKLERKLSAAPAAAVLESCPITSSSSSSSSFSISSSSSSSSTVLGSISGINGSGEDAVEMTAAQLTCLQATVCYVREFLAKANPHLGRKGPTCPFVPLSLRLNSIYLGVVSQQQASTEDQVADLVFSMIQKFRGLSPTEGAKATYKAIILTFVDMPLSLAPRLIDGVQKRLKPLFVAEGLMVGEFHLNNNATGLHNPNFYPLRTPYPSMAIRYMVPSDVVFLSPTEFLPSVRRGMLQMFIDKFGGQSDSDQQIQLAREMLAKLENE